MMQDASNAQQAAVAAAPAAAAGGAGPAVGGTNAVSSSSSVLSSSAVYSQDTAIPYLSRLADRAPSRNVLQYLAGNVAASMKLLQQQDTTTTNSSSEVAFMFLKAAAQQLSTCCTTSTASSSGLKPAPPSALSQSNHAENGVVESSSAASTSLLSDGQTTKYVYEIVDGIGYAVTRCSPRSIISQSGILPVLASLCASGTPSSMAGFAPPVDAASTSSPLLSNLHVEFLQACVYAGQYRYAERSVAGTWPRPSGLTPVRLVLRYYYLRGTIHLGCQNWEWATRCFWTCLCIPADMVSAIAIAAWKKLVLIQCLTTPSTSSSTTPGKSSSSNNNPGGSASTCAQLQLPKAAPPCLTRFLSAAFQPKSGSSGGGRGGGGDPSSGAANPEEHDHEAMLVAAGGSEYSYELPPPHYPAQQAQQGGGASNDNNANAGPNSYQALGVKPYADFCQAFSILDKEALDTLVRDHQALFTADGNIGLVQQCVTDFQKHQVYHYSRIYSRLQIQDLSAMMQLPVEQIQTLLLQLSMEKVWSIQLDDATGIISFPRLLPSTTTVQDGGAAHATQLIELTRMVQKLDLAIAASPKYLSIVKNVNSGGGGGDKMGAGAGMFSGPPRGVEDI